MSEPRLVDPGAHAAPATTPSAHSGGVALLEPAQVESLLLNLEASLRVHTRSHLFGWTQGLLQSLIPHDVLICALRARGPAPFRIDSFSTMVPDAGVFGDLLLRDASVVTEVAKSWKHRQFRPQFHDAGSASGAWSGALGRRLARTGATRVIVHGSHDADGDVASLFVFAARPGAIGPMAVRLVELVVPFLHAAWVRSLVEAGEATRLPQPGAATLTAREREVLRWICLGKNSAEVGAILEISPLTVKNHVQKILRKLNVVNRAQAVTRALEARLIEP